jgi:hypothetical protein
MVLKISCLNKLLDPKPLSSMTSLTSTQGICLPNKVYKILKRLSRKRKSLQWLVERTRIILLASWGLGPGEIARQTILDFGF